MITEEKKYFERYNLLKKEIELPVKTKLYFLIFENAVFQPKDTKPHEFKNTFSKSLLSAFLNLSSIEKGKYLLNNMSFVAEHLERKEKLRIKADSTVDGYD
jgi:hypothetical protein